MFFFSRRFDMFLTPQKILSTHFLTSHVPYDKCSGPKPINCRFHCHTIIKTINKLSQESKRKKEDEYSNSVAKIQVCAIFRVGDI